MPHKTGRSLNGDSGSDAQRSGATHKGAGLSPAETASSDVDRRATERILAAVREAGVQQIELQFADVTGAVKTVAVPARRIAAVLAEGEWFDGSAIEGLAREVESDMYLRPDPTTFSIMEPSGVTCARLICEVVTPSGEPYPGDGRGTLRSLLDSAESAGLGYLVAPEIEFFLFPADVIGPLADDTSTYFERTRGRSRRVELEIVAGLEAMGIHIESSHHEVASGQFELDLPLLPALVAADTVTTLKPAVKELARDREMQASFMPKPLSDAAGSGMHTHQVLVDRTGRSVFDDASDPYGLSAIAKSFLAGQLEHAPGMSALVAPVVNSYKRLVPGYEAPVAGSWGRHSRGALIRVPTPVQSDSSGEVFCTRLELRLPDPSCNPYLAFTAMLAAGLDGLDRGLELGPPLEELEHGFGGSAHSVTKPLPASLGEALAALEDDDVITAALGSELMELFHSAKTLEWEAYRRQVTQWERDTYFQRC
ncbi:MAG: glutamine synthetase family protein [Candidatus Limnocylindrales bacterium]|jgi:glutamine synthetase